MSMIAQPAGALGAITLPALADGTSLSAAIVIGGIIYALAAPLYIPTLRAERTRKSAMAAAPAAS
jgi:MFS-type transporter involved in bile tolerance (Atg22 family)